MPRVTQMLRVRSFSNAFACVMFASVRTARLLLLPPSSSFLLPPSPLLPLLSVLSRDLHLRRRRRKWQEIWCRYGEEARCLQIAGEVYDEGSGGARAYVCGNSPTASVRCAICVDQYFCYSGGFAVSACARARARQQVKGVSHTPFLARAFGRECGMACRQVHGAV